MKNLIFISAFTFLFNWTATAAGHISRDSSWTYGGNGGLNLSQVSLNNWASGGENAVGFDVLLNYSADYKKNKHLWQNRIEMAYGLNQTETSGTKKTNDKLYFSKDLNDAFMSILKENNVFEYDNGFMMTGHIYTYAQLQGENLFKRGFLTTTTLVNGNITQSRINDFMAFLNLAMVPLDILNAEPVAIGSQDNNPSVVGLFSRVYADADDGRVDGKTGIDWIKQKYNFVIELLKTYGIDTDKLQHPEI